MSLRNIKDITTGGGHAPDYAVIEEETLSDDSLVYNVRIGNHLGYIRMDCDDLEAAQDLVAVLNTGRYCCTLVAEAEE